MLRLPKIDPTDPAAVSRWLETITATVNDLRDTAADATAPRGHRRHSRTYLRDRLRRGFKELTAQLNAIDPAGPAERAP